MGFQSRLEFARLDMLVSRVRNRLALLPEDGWRLRALYGHGYRLEQCQPVPLLT